MAQRTGCRPPGVNELDELTSRFDSRSQSPASTWSKLARPAEEEPSGLAMAFERGRQLAWVPWIVPPVGVGPFDRAECVGHGVGQPSEHGVTQLVRCGE